MRVIPPALAVLLLTALLWSHTLIWSPAWLAAGPIHFVYTTTVTYLNEGDGPWALSDSDVAVTLFMDTPWQSVELAWTNWPVRYRATDPDGNNWAVLGVPDMELGPGEELTISARYEMVSMPRKCTLISVDGSGSLTDIPSGLVENFTGPGACWQTEHEELRELALNLSAGKTKVLEIVASFVYWISENVEYESFETPLYPNETYERGRGDCDDQANLFITLCRIVGIPAYLQLGCLYVPWLLNASETAWDGHLTIKVSRIGWHGWAVAYVPPWGWLPVDLTTAGVREDPLNAIRMAAIWRQSTFLAMQIIETDYIGGCRAAREFVVGNDIYIYVEEELRMVEEERPDMTMVYVLITSVCTATAVCAIVLALLFRKKPPPPRDPGGRAHEAPRFAYQS